MIKFFKYSSIFSGEISEKNDIRVYKRDNHVLVSVGDWCEISDEVIRTKLQALYPNCRIEIDSELGDYTKHGYELIK